MSSFRRSAPVCLSLLLVVMSLFGCSEATPEQKLEIAFAKVQEQRPPDLPGASNLLKEIVASETAEPDTRLQAYLMLAELYQSIGDLEKALDFINQAVEYFGLDTEQGQTSHVAKVAALMRLGNSQQARAISAAGDEAPPEAKDAVDEEVLQEAFEEVEMMISRDDLPGPRRVWYRLRKAELFDALGEADQAAELFYQLSIEFDDQQIEQIALEQHVQIVLREGPEAGARSYIRFSEEKPESPTASMARFGAGVFLQQAGNQEQAEELMQEFVTQVEAELENEELDDNTRISKSMSLARAHALARNPDGERAVYDDLIKRYKDNHNLVVRLIQSVIQSHLAQENFQAAIETLAEYERDFAGTQIADMTSGMAARVIQFQKEIQAQMEAVKQAEAASGGAQEAGESAPEEAEAQAAESAASATGEESVPAEEPSASTDKAPADETSSEDASEAETPQAKTKALDGSGS